MAMLDANQSAPSSISNQHHRHVATVDFGRELSWMMQQIDETAQLV
jgi:hypothetical protein